MWHQADDCTTIDEVGDIGAGILEVDERALGGDGAERCTAGASNCLSARCRGAGSSKLG
jgi:hypothetical protein